MQTWKANHTNSWSSFSRKEHRPAAASTLNQPGLNDDPKSIIYHNPLRKIMTPDTPINPKP